MAKIALAGEGGQGVQIIAQIMVKAAFNEKKNVCYLPNFGLEQRGGVSLSFVQISDNEIGAPKFKISDTVIALSKRAVKRTEQYVGPDTIYIYDNSKVDEKPDYNAKKIVGIPATDVANKELSSRVFNIIILGTAIKITGILNLDSVRNALEESLKEKFLKKPELKDLNFRALERGMSLVENVL